MRKSRVLSLLIVLASLIGFSCKVGLGEAVDTVPPTVTITYPPAGSVVRDTFVLAGDCDDDTNVLAVDVYYERTGTYSTVKTKLATVNVTPGDKTWSLEIDPVEKDIKDGPYVFYAVSRDTEGRSSGTYTQSIEIDNTAPILILTKPTSFGSSENFKEYGRSVSIEGTFAESTESRIDKLVVTFYNENGTKVEGFAPDNSDTTFDDITDMSNANPLIIAKYDPSTGDDLVQKRHKIYTTLYGNNLNEGAKRFYFTVTAYDKAKRYTDPSESGGTGDGNASLGFYRGTNDILNLINGNKEGYSSFSVKKIQELKNGLSDEYANDDTIGGWLDAAFVPSAAPTVSTPRTALSQDGLSPERKEKTLKFSMNPANYPTFTVSGLDIKTGSEANDDNHTDGYFRYYSGTPLNFAIMAGLDGTQIDVPTISIYVEKTDGSNRQLVQTWNPTVGAANPTKWTHVNEGENADSVAKTIPLNFTDYTGISSGTKWRFVAVGEDINHQPIGNYDDDGYGFIASISTQAATIKIGATNDSTNTNPATNSVKGLAAYDNFKFSGKVTSDDTPSMTATLEVTDSSGEMPKKTSPGTVSLTNSNTDWNVTMSPNSDAKTYMQNHPGLYNLIFTIKASNGGGASQVTRTFNIDNRAPEILVSGLTNSVKKDGEDIYYIKSSGDFELSGTTMDNYIVDRTEIRLTGNGTAKDYTRTTSTWYVEPDFSGFAAQSGEDNDVLVTITAYDKADNSSTKTLHVEFDNVAPVVKHELDNSGKDIIFRIGDADNDEVELGNKGLTFTDEKDKNVGGKYSAGSYGNSTTMKIRGKVEDQGSGVNMIYYQVIPAGSTETLMTTSNYKTVNTGYFAPLAEGTPQYVALNKKRVKKNLSSSSYEYVTSDTNFEAILTGFAEGNNSLRIITEDNVGNVSLDQVYSLNVDMTPPTIESSSGNSIPTNGIDAIAQITGTADDDGSGFESASKNLEFYIGKPKYKITADGSNNTPKGSYTFTQVSGNHWEWTLNIDNSNGWLMNPAIQAEITGTPGVYANIKDKAGLSTNAVRVTGLTIDSTPPTIQIGTIKDAYTGTTDVTEVNGKIEITGSADDNRELSDIDSEKTPVLYYRTTDPGNGAITSNEGWTKVADSAYSDKSGSATWSYKALDTTKAFGSNEKRTVWLMASVKDKAGNTGYSAAKKIVVDQNTDRPVITFTHLETKDSWLKRKDLHGNISDDDGIEDFRIFIGDACPNDWTLTGSVTSGVSVMTSATEWAYPDVGDDGIKNLWFYVKDKGGSAAFISACSTPSNRPYYRYFTATEGIISGDYGLVANSALPVKKDTQQPEISTTLITIAENEAGLESIATILSKDVGSYQLTSSKITGGKKSHFKIYVPVYDEFVKDVKAEIRDEKNKIETLEYNINGGPKETITLTSTGYKTSDNKFTYYEGEVIDVSSLASGKSGVKSVQVTVHDEAGNEKVQTYSLSIDNKGPEVKFISPLDGVVTGPVTITGTSIDANATVEKTWWMIPTATQKAKSDVELMDDPAWSDKRDENSTPTSWQFVFNGETNGNPLLTEYDSYWAPPVNDIYTLPLFIKSVDSVGNCTIERSFVLKHNPDADKPVTKIMYPSEKDYTSGNNFVTLGGTIRVTGSVTIPSLTTNPKKVYIQIADENGDFGTTDKTKAGNYGYTIKTVSSVASDIGREVIGLGNPEIWWGIETNGSSNTWSINLNEANCIGARNIKIRACGVNELGKMGTWSDPVFIHIDASTPEYTTKLYQFPSTPAVGSQTAEIDYEPGIYLKGQWYLGLHITDDDLVLFESATLNDVAVDSSKITQIFSNSNKTLDLFIKLDADSNITQSYRIAASDKAEPNYHYIYPNYDINIDNTAPELSNIKGNNELLVNEAVVSEKNYVYTLSGDVIDSGSGFERVLFYFIRPDSSDSDKKVIINPMLTSNPKTKLSTLASFEVDGFTLWGKTVAGKVKESTFTPTTASDVTGNPNIRAGGLIFVEGVYRKIAGISNDGKVTLETNTGITVEKTTSAKFPYGQVIDNLSTEKPDGNNASPEFVITNDDGDQMPETVTKAGAKYSWDGTIHSSNMPDGPVTLVVLAFDKAGNVSGTQYRTMVQNHAPRLAKVYLGTDLNKNGSFVDEEFETYNIGAKAGASDKGLEAFTLTTANFETYTLNPRSEWEASSSNRKAFTVKKDLIVLPELVGGNGEIKVVFNKSDTTTEADGHQTGTVDPKTGTLASPNTITGDYWKYSDFGGDGTKKVSFTFWDSTEECTPGVDSQYVFLRITDLNVDQIDDVDPNVVIEPFFWNDEDDNSLYQNSKANGHIELESDWTATDDGGVKLTSWDGKGKKLSTYLDSDPKVSGKIVLRGTAYDDTLLKTLQFSMTNFDTTTVKTFATYTAADGWTVTKVGGSNPTMASNYYEVTVTEDYLNQNGHKVSWEIAIDTAHLSDVAHIDAVFTVIALDDAGRSSANRTASETVGDATLHRPSYAMDVVPYITGVKRNEDYNTHRSGMGNYPLMREEEENTITGFNLGTTAKAGLRISSASNVITGLDVDDLTVSASGNSATFTIPATAVDGYLQYYVQSGTENVPALNNMNSNAVYTKENGDTRWYDDRFVRIWQSNASDKFAASYPTYPAMAMGSNGDLFMSYTFYSKSVVYYNQLMSNTKTQVFTAGDQPEETDIMINGTNEVNVIYQSNHHYGGTQDRWSARVSGAGSINLYNPSAPNIGTYAIGRYWRFEGTWHNQMLQQLKNAKVATSGNNVYHTIWYDKITKAIKYSNVNKSATQNAYIPNDNDASRPGEIGWVVLDGDADLDDIVQTNQRTTNGYNGGEARYPNNTFEHSYLNGVGNVSMYSIALSKTPAQRTAIMNLDENSLRKDAAITANGNYNRYDYTGAGTGTTGYNVDCYESVNPTSTCGEYAAICVTSDGYPVVVYYDVDHKMLKVARAISTNPKGMNTANTNDGAAAWRIQRVALTSGHLGNDASYVSAVIDSAGYLHIAFQNSRGELIYTRSTNTTSALTLTQGFTFDGSVIVDTNGTWASITVDSNDLPQIAYMANTSGYDTLKLAYPVNATWKTATNWETMYAPMNAKSSNVKTCVVARPSNATGGQPTGLTTYWKTGIGFATSEDYRVMKYIGSGTRTY